MRHEVIALSDGWEGTNKTVATASRLVQDSLTDPLVVTTAQNLVRNLPERDKDAEIEAISRFVRRKIRYTNEGLETLKTPRLMLDEIKKYGKAVGDCDDHVILWAALHRAVGTRVRFKVISQRRDKMANHIYGEVYSPNRGWVTDDTIVKNKPVGWEIPSRQRTKNVVYPLNGLGGDHMGKDFWAGGAYDDSDFLPPSALQFAQQLVTPMTGSNIKRGGALEIREDGSVSGVGDGVFDVVGSLLTKGIEVATAKINARAAALSVPKVPAAATKPAGGGSLLQNPIVQIGGVLVGGFVAYKIAQKMRIF